MRAAAALAVVVVSGVLAGCGDGGGDGGDDDPRIDASGGIDAATIDGPPMVDGPPMIDGPPVDAPTSTVVEVTPCPAGDDLAVIVTSPGFNYAFDGTVGTTHTIAVDEVVQFQMPASHNAVSGPANQPDGQFSTGFNQTKCWRFTAAGSFPFHCTPHDFAATLVVE